ncbi:MAG: hypothetical protein COA32_11430 [Fluviicola sp.]|nr:MAG: hypothetical protein COA32_11430 [Fluviicola sp.]
MNNQISVIIKRYLIASVIALAGLIMIILGLQSNQDTLFVVAAINLFVGGVLAVLFSAGILNRVFVFVIGAVCIIVTAFVGYQSYEAVQSTIAHNKARKVSEQLVQYNLTQVRDIQRAYKSKHGVYASTWNELFDFFNNGKIEIIESSGSVPQDKINRKELKALYDDNRAIDKNMTEREAALLAEMGNPGERPELEGFKRDTVMVSYKDEYLNSISRIKLRNSLGLGAFNVEDLKYIPMTDPKEEWTLETLDSFVYLNDTIPTIHVYGKEPIPRFEGGEREIVGFGNLNTNSEKGTWE